MASECFNITFLLLAGDRNWKKEAHKTYEFTRYRRHSLPYTPFENELAKIYEKKAKALMSTNAENRPIIKRRTHGRKPGGKARANEDESEGWMLSGKDLHAFYSFWDRPEYLKRKERSRNGNIPTYI